MCDPIDACVGGDRCTRPYFGPFCSKCRFRYYRDDDSSRCLKCGWEQKMGVFVITSAMTLLTIGSLIFTIIMMKFKADLRFQTVMKNVWRTRVVTPA